MILVADSGSSKTAWCAINPAGEQFFFNTQGYNPFFMKAAYMLESIKAEIPPNLDRLKVSSVFFYGSGCQGEKVGEMEAVLKQVFLKAENITIEIDLLGAARALLRNNAGFAAILGTGTNTCLYDGTKITQNIDSLGFLLGDEGSGAAIGKHILSDYLRNKMPLAVRQIFKQEYKLSNEELLEQVYETQQPNRYCASYAKFLDLEGVKKPYGEELVKEVFDQFFKNLVSVYPNYNQYEFNCIGSIGYTFKSILADTAQHYKMKVGKIIPSIISSLAAYHFDPKIKEASLLSSNSKRIKST